LVLSLLEADSIGRGQFLLHNSIGSVQFFSLTNLYLQNPIDRILWISVQQDFLKLG
jgi:hypothetical protein